MRRAANRRTRIVACACFAVSLLAILLWGKLKLVAAVPRTAYAEPHKGEPAPRPIAGASDPSR